MKKSISIYFLLFVAVLILAGCSAQKFVPEGQYMLHRVEIKSMDRHLDPASLEPYIRQKPNSKWFSIFKVPLGMYALSSKDTTKWINRTFQNIGEAPVIFDSLQAWQTRDDLTQALHNMGYMNAQVDIETKVKKRRLDVVFILKPGTPYYINNLSYDIQDDSIARILQLEDARQGLLHKGDYVTVDLLDRERKRITQQLMDTGYYHFNKDFIRFTADTVSGNKGVDLTLHLQKYRVGSSADETLHPRYRIGRINYLSDDSTSLPLRMSVLKENTWLSEGSYFSSRGLQQTYNALGRLNALRYTNIRLVESSDSSLLDCNIQLSPNKRNSISFQPEGTNTSGDLGAAASITYSNRNIFRGSETFSLQVRGAYEAITSLEGYQNQNYIEYNVEAKLQFPRLLTFFMGNSIRRRHPLATSEVSFSWNVQNRPEFHRRLFSAAWRYRWENTRNRRLSWRFDVLDLNFVSMPWISSTFKHEYLDSVTNRNAILRYNYEDLFIMKTGVGMSYSNGVTAVKASLETAGNLLRAVSALSGASQNQQEQYTFLGIAYAQYVKADVDYTHLITIDRNNQLALHAGFGIAYPYGNSTMLPFEKRYFSGGANSVRGWSVRELGPGGYQRSDGRIDFINQTGDMKLDLNAELRSKLFWKLYGAFFVDAGNIWTIRDYSGQPNGQFSLDKFYNQIAVAYGIGIRFNFDYFILRFDMGMKAINPAYESGKEHWPIAYPRLSRDFAFHFAVGLPF